MRLFVAVFPPDDVCRDLRDRLTSAGSPQLTPIDRWHVTMAFIGELPEGRLFAVERALDQVSVPKGTELRVRGGGHFARSHSTVLWAGVQGELAGLHADIRERLRVADLPYDGRDFMPHLTVAYTDDAGVRAALGSYRGPTWTLDRIALVRVDPDGGYTTLSAW